MSDEAVRGVVVGHAALADALVAAVERIVGDLDGSLVALSNEGLGPEAIRVRLEELVGGGPVIVFSDLHQGSCGLAAKRVCLGRDERRLVTGANLPMLLDFVVNRQLPLDELARRVTVRARAAIDIAGPGPDG